MKMMMMIMAIEIITIVAVDSNYNAPTKCSENLSQRR